MSGGTDTGYGWTCQGCRRFVPYGVGHACGTTHPYNEVRWTDPQDSGWLAATLRQILDELRAIRVAVSKETP